MAWTSPNTAVAGNVISAADHNTYLRDNLLYLFNGRPASQIMRDNAGIYTTTSATPVAIDSTNLSITVTVRSGRALIWFSGVAFYSGGTYSVWKFDIDIDGALLGASFADGLAISPNSSGAGSGLVSWNGIKTGLSDGSHTFKPFWWVASGTGAIASGAATGGDHPITFGVMEI
jgi:hypothetical protein